MSLLKEDKKKLILINPATEEEIATIEKDTTKQINAKIQNLKTHQSQWEQIPLKKRILLLRKAGEILNNNKERIAKLITVETGKPIIESLPEVKSTVKRIEYFCDNVEKALRPEKGKTRYFSYENIRKPVGLVGAIKPWNFSVNIPIWTIIPGLLAGNTVLFKPSEHSILVGLSIAEILYKAGISKNFFDIVIGSAKAGREICKNKNIDMISFVGSQATGKKIYKESAKFIRRIVLELGGKDPVIVLDDCNLEKTADIIVKNSLKNCGQVCCSTERVYAPEKLLKPLSSLIIEKVKKLKIGNPLNKNTNIGPLINKQGVERVKNQIKDAETKGARVLYGSTKKYKSKGYFIKPAVIIKAKENSLLLKEETFGPVIPIIEYDDAEKLISKLNKEKWGLTAIVCGEPIAAKRTAKKINSGTVGVNQTIGSLENCPWGGCRQSGVNRLLSEKGIQIFTDIINFRY